jgi:sortase A
VLALVGWLVLYAFVLSGLQEQHAQHNLYASFRSELALGTAPVGGDVPEGSPVAVLTAHAIGLDSVVVVEGTTARDLRSGPGHLPASVLPGQYGLSVLFGRSLSFGGPFARVGELRPGDAIGVTTAQGTFAFTVRDVRRAGDPTPPALTATQSRLTLVSTEGSGWRSGWAPTRTVYVDADLSGTPVGGPVTFPAGSPDDAPMRGQTDALFPLVLWLQLLALGVVGIVLARLRWGAWQAWIVGLPVVIAALWGASSSAWLLLPNLV